MSVGKRIKKLRVERGITRKDMSQKLGINEKTLGNWEIERRTPKVETVKVLAEYFGVSIDYLTTGKNNNASDLEKDFPEGIRMLRRANNELDEEDKERLLRYVEFMLQDSKKRKKNKE